MKSGLFLAAVILLSGCTQTGTGPAGTQLYKIYNSPHYTVGYPADWALQEQGALVMFQSPSDGPNDAMYENVNVIVVPSTTYDIDEYTTDELGKLRAQVPNFELLDFSEDPIPGLASNRLVYTEDDGENKFQYMQVLAIEKEKTFVITYSALADTFPAHLKTASDMISSFKPKTDTPQSTPTPEAPASAYPELTKKWRVYSQAIFYDRGGFNYLETPATTLLELKPDYTWTFGSSKGTWQVADITETDWTKWGVGDYGPTKKLVLDGWNNDVADGPIEGNIDFLWAIYRTGPPIVQSPGQIQMKFGWTNQQ